MTRLILLPLLLCVPFFSSAQSSSDKSDSLFVSAERSSVSQTPSNAVSTIEPSNNSTVLTKTGLSGIVPPKLVHTIPMKDDGNQHVHIEGRRCVVTIYLIVNAAGQPTDLQIPEPVDDALDVEVLATVGKFRYQPGTLDGKVTPMPIHMHYVVPVGAVY